MSVEPEAFLHDVGGIPLEVRRAGPGPQEAPTLVFLHEGLGSAGLWRDFPARLAAATGCGWMAYSRAGYGRSGPAALPRPVTYLHHEALEVLPEVLRALDIGEHVLIGHSDGGSVALIHAGAAALTGLRGVVTEAAHVFNEELSRQGIREAVAAYEAGDLRGRLARHHDHVDVAFRGWSDTWLSDAFLTWNLEAYLPGIRVPALVMQGLDDGYGTPAQVEAIVRGIGARAEALLLPGCGHTPHREAPDVTLAAMAAFVMQVTGRGAV